MTIRRRHLLFAGAAGAVAPRARAQAFDHGHAAWTTLLQRHVVVLRGGQASQVRYEGFGADRRALQAYLDTLSAVSASAFASFGKAQQQALLINAYNAHTIALILTRYPDLESIKDLGGWLTSPWKPKWISLLGAKVSLDDIEHEMLRKRGVYDEPRVHFAVNCAAVGCPMLREEAFVAERLEAQLEQQARRFMADRTRNRYNAQRTRLELSRIFDWYGDDFRLGHRGLRSVVGFAAMHADALADAPADRDRVRDEQVGIAFLDYDWALNDVRNGAR